MIIELDLSFVLSESSFKELIFFTQIATNITNQITEICYELEGIFNSTENEYQQKILADFKPIEEFTGQIKKITHYIEKLVLCKDIIQTRNIGKIRTGLINLSCRVR